MGTSSATCISPVEYRFDTNNDLRMSYFVPHFLELMRLGSLVCVPFAFCDLVGVVQRVDGVSMQPTLNPKVVTGKKDFVIVNRFSASKYNFNRGEIVTFISPKDHKITMIKRVIGLPGDYVRSRTDKQHLVPKGHCWVEGDNQTNTIDSNHFGPIPMGLIQAKVSYVVLPLARAGKLEIKEPTALKVSKYRHLTDNNLKREKNDVPKPEDRIVDLDEALYTMDLYGEPSTSTSGLDSLADSKKEQDNNTDSLSNKSRRSPS